MSAPALAQYVQGQGSVSADNLNTFEQTCDSIAQLSGFIGLPGIQVYVRGTVTPNDGGQGAFFWSATSPGPGNGTTIIVPTGAAIGAWIRLANGENAPRGFTDVTAFGAQGDGTTDDTASIQAAINAVRAAGGGVVYYPGPANYLVTASLNSTGTTGNHPIRHIGDGTFVSNIVHTFGSSEAYPVFDGCGNTRGGTLGISIKRQGTSYATAAYLAAKGAAGGAIGNSQVFENSYFDAGNVVGDGGLVIYNADRTDVLKCEGSSGGTGLSVGFSKPANVTSKFITLSSELDWTQGSIAQSDFEGTNGPGLAWTGGAALVIEDSYFALIGSGSGGKVVEVTSPDSSSGNCLWAHGLRTENQSSATGVFGIYTTAQMANAEIVGSIESGSSTGIMIGSGASGPILNTYFKIVGAGKLFGLTAPITNSVIDAQPGNGVGTCSAVSTCANLEFMGGTDAAALLTLFGSIPGLKISQSGLTYRSMFGIFFPPTLPTLHTRVKAVLKEAVSATSSYTNPSVATVFTDTLRLGALQFWTGNLPSPNMIYSMSLFCPGFASSGTFALQIVQGVNTSELISLTPPTTSNVSVEVSIKIFTTSNPTLLRAMTIVTFGGTASFTNIKNLESDSISPTAGDATLNLRYTNSANIGGGALFVLCEI